MFFLLMFSYDDMVHIIQRISSVCFWLRRDVMHANDAWGGRCCGDFSRVEWAVCGKTR